MRTLWESRKYEVLMPDGSWVPVHWEQLDKGDMVRCNPALPEDVYHTAEPFVIDKQPVLSTETLEVVMKAQLMMDEDVITIEDLMEKYKISVAYLPGQDGALAIWAADVFENGKSKASSAGHTLRDAVEILVNLLD